VVKYCSKCGTENNGENQFCFSCGVVFQSAVVSETPPAVIFKDSEQENLVANEICTADDAPVPEDANVSFLKKRLTVRNALIIASVFIIIAVAIGYYFISGGFGGVSNDEMREIMKNYMDEDLSSLQVIKVVNLPKNIMGMSENDDNKLVMFSLGTDDSINYYHSAINTSEKKEYELLWNMSAYALNVYYRFNENENINEQNFNIIHKLIREKESLLIGEEYINKVTDILGLARTRTVIQNIYSGMVIKNCTLLFRDESAVPVFHAVQEIKKVYNWGSVFGQDRIEVQLQQSILEGNSCCIFTIHLRQD